MPCLWEVLGVSISDGSETTAGERHKQRRERGRVCLSVCLSFWLAGWLSEQTTVRDRMPGYSTGREIYRRGEEQSSSSSSRERRGVESGGEGRGTRS